MRKKVILFGLLLGILTLSSCANTKNSSISNVSQNSSQEWSYEENVALGRTISVINDTYADVTGKYQTIFDDNKLKNHFKIIFTPNNSEDSFVEIQESIQSLINNMAVAYESKINSSSNFDFGLFNIPMLFGADIENEFKLNCDYKRVEQTKEIMAHMYYYRKKHMLTLEGNTNLNKFKECLSPAFLEELQNVNSDETANKILNKYGTHVITSGIYGGRLDFNYMYYYNSSKNSTSIELDEKFKTKFKTTILNLFSSKTNTETNFDLSTELEIDKVEGQEYIYVKNKGGKASGSLTSLNALVENYDEWISSIEEYNTLIDFPNNSLIAIWDLLPETPQYESVKNLLFNACITKSNEDYQSLMDKYRIYGTSTTPYLINSAEEFVNYLNSSSAGTYFKLQSDINFIDCPNVVNEFYGTLDGNNHVIKNFMYSIPNNSFKDEKFFGIIQKNYGEIFNLTLENVSINAPETQHCGGWINVGGLVGINYPKAVIRNVTVKNSKFNINRAGSRLGGIAGVNEGNIIDCTVEKNKFFSNGDCGGICGKNSAILQNVTFIGDNFQSWSSDIPFTYWIVGKDDDKKKNGGNRSWGGIVGYNTLNARLLGFRIENIYMLIEGDEKKTPKIGYAVGHNEGYICGAQSNQALGNKKEAKEIKTTYWFSSSNGLIGRNDNATVCETCDTI